MEYRHPLMVIFLTFFTFGIYYIVWIVKTKNEMNRHHAVYLLPAWSLLIPFYNLYWLWCYAKGVETVTQGKRSEGEVLLLLFFLYMFGMAILQTDFNKIYIPKQVSED